jgi:PAS domain S-box-containing protein
MVNFQSAFESVPGAHLLLLPNAPHFTIVSITEDHFLLNQKTREELIGSEYFEATPTENTGAKKELVNAFQNVLVQKQKYQLPVLRYDIKNEEGNLVEKYWKICNTPILNNSNTLEYILHSAEDITNEIIAEKKLKTSGSLEKAYNFFMNAPVIIGLLQGDDYTIELANEGLLEVWGRTNEVVGKPLLEAIPELEDQGFIHLLENVRITGEAFYAYEYPINLVRHGKEETLYFDFVYKPLYENGDTGKASGIISVGHDVTTQVLAKKKLENSEAKYRTLFESMDQGFCILEMIFDDNQKPIDYRFLEINPVFEKQTGLKDAINKTARQLLPDLEPHWFELYGKVAQTGNSIRFTEGSEVMGKWFDVYAFSVDDSGKKVALLFTDITEQRNTEQNIRESEERFRNLADDSPIFIFIIDDDPNATVSYWNKTWLEYTGQTLEQAIGRAWDGIVHPDDVPVVMEHYTKAFQNKRSYYIPAVRVKRKDGNYRWHAFKGNPRYQPNGKFNGYVGVGFDIHEQKIAEEKLKQNEIDLQQKVAERTAELLKTVEELKRSNTNLEEFAYAASHDLKEPIRKIHFFSDRLKRSLHDHLIEDDQKTFERMEAASKRMNSLIDDLLSYSQVSLRTHVLDKVDLNELIDLVLNDLDLEIEDKNATITVDRLFSIPGHHRQLQQVFQNLIGNALKYSKADVPLRIHIKCNIEKIVDESMSFNGEKHFKEFFIVSIIDNGIGFDQKDADRIFNVFTRLHGNAQFRGSGIGLSIVRKIIENHNGFITAEGKSGEGATFKLFFPAEVIEQ